MSLVQLSPSLSKSISFFFFFFLTHCFFTFHVLKSFPINLTSPKLSIFPNHTLLIFSSLIYPLFPHFFIFRLWCIFQLAGQNEVRTVIGFPMINDKMPQSKLGSMQGSTKGLLPLKVVFHRRLSSTEGCLPPKVVFPKVPKVVFHQRSSSTEDRLPRKIVFHRRLSSTKGRLPKKVVFH